MAEVKLKTVTFILEHSELSTKLKQNVESDNTVVEQFGLFRNKRDMGNAYYHWLQILLFCKRIKICKILSFFCCSVWMSSFDSLPKG